MERIRFVQLRETAAARLLGLGAVYLHAVGVTRQRENLLPVIPVVRARHLPELLQGLLPEFQPGPVTVRPAAGSLLRYIGPALAAMVGAGLERMETPDSLAHPGGFDASQLVFPGAGTGSALGRYRIYQW